jgi:hypothetical protein
MPMHASSDNTVRPKRERLLCLLHNNAHFSPSRKSGSLGIRLAETPARPLRRLFGYAISYSVETHVSIPR